MPFGVATGAGEGIGVGVGVGVGFEVGFGVGVGFEVGFGVGFDVGVGVPRREGPGLLPASLALICPINAGSAKWRGISMGARPCGVGRPPTSTEVDFRTRS